MNPKEIKISFACHQALKTYCRDNGIKIGHFVESTIYDKLRSLKQTIPIKTFEDIKK